MITTILKETLDHLGFSYTDILEESGISGRVFQIKTDNAPLIIGTDGANLTALNHIVKKIAEKNGLEIDFAIDVNEYQKAKNEEIVRKAKMLADRVRAFQSDIELEPMSPYERMIFHNALLGESNVATESVGMGKGRHIVIRFKEEKKN